MRDLTTTATTVNWLVGWRHFVLQTYDAFQKRKISSLELSSLLTKKYKDLNDIWESMDSDDDDEHSLHSFAG